MRMVTRPTLKKTDKKHFNVSRLISFFALLAVCFVWVIPLVWMIGTSLKTNNELVLNPTSLWPTMGFNFEHYIGLLTFSGTTSSTETAYFGIVRWLGNSTLVAVLSVFLQLVVFTLAAYAYTFMDFRFKKLTWAIIIGSMTIPGVATYVAKYSILISLGSGIDLPIWYRYVCIILPGTAGVFNLFLTRQFFLSIPKDLVESAKMDGASNMKIFLSIILPLSKSVLFVTCMFSFIGSWNAYEWPSLIMSGVLDRNYQLLTPGLIAWADGSTAVGMGRTMAAATISSLPIIIIYCFCQNRIIDGIASTGVKR